MPAKLAFGVPHPDPVVETASLASVEPPDITYELHLDDLVASGGLSALQLESIVYACQRHATVLPDAQRAGFFIGDGAGVGKGRTIAGAADFVPASGADCCYQWSHAAALPRAAAAVASQQATQNASCADAIQAVVNCSAKLTAK